MKKMNRVLPLLLILSLFLTSMPVAKAAKPLTIVTEELPNAYEGKYYCSPPIEVTGGTPGYTFTVTDLPEGLTFDESDRRIKGTPVIDEDTYEMDGLIVSLYEIYIEVVDSNDDDDFSFIELYVVSSSTSKPTTAKPTSTGSRVTIAPPVGKTTPTPTPKPTLKPTVKLSAKPTATPSRTASPANVFVTGYGQLLDNITGDDIPRVDTSNRSAPCKSYDFNSTKEEIDAMQKLYPRKDTRTGNTHYTYSLGYYAANGKRYLNMTSVYYWGKTEYCYREKKWVREKTATMFPTTYSENYMLFGTSGGNISYNSYKKTECYLYKEDEEFEYAYTWIKGEKTGKLSKTEKVSEPNDDEEIPVRYFIFPDTILGEQCKKYGSYASGKRLVDPGDWEVFWISTETGSIIQKVKIHQDREHASGLISAYVDTGWTFDRETVYVDYYIEKPDSFFEPPANVVFQ